MPRPVHDLDEVLALVSEAEQLWSLVSLERIRGLARARRTSSGLTRNLARLVTKLTTEGALHQDRRARLARDGTLRPTRVYRLNNRHPRCQRLLGSSDEDSLLDEVSAVAGTPVQ